MKAALLKSMVASSLFLSFLQLKAKIVESI